MDVTEFAISKAKKHAISQIDFAQDEFHTAKGTFPASTANIHADPRSFQAIGIEQSFRYQLYCCQLYS